MNASVVLRSAGPADVPVVHRLIAVNLEAGHLLPRTVEDVARHAERFVVAHADGEVVGCAELAPLSGQVAEVRSLVVDEALRGRQIGGALVGRIAVDAAAQGFAVLCAFTHEPSHFVRLGFTIVPHIWVPEKIAHDCTACPLFRKCGQHAVLLPLRTGVRVQPERPAAVIYGGRAIAGRRAIVERLQVDGASPAAKTGEAIPA